MTILTTGVKRNSGSRLSAQIGEEKKEKRVRGGKEDGRMPGNQKDWRSAYWKKSFK